MSRAVYVPHIAFCCVSAFHAAPDLKAPAFNVAGTDVMASGPAIPGSPEQGLRGIAITTDAYSGPAGPSRLFVAAQPAIRFPNCVLG